MKRWQGLIEEFKDYSPVNEDIPKLTLDEGYTPLVHCANISEMPDIDLYVKYEGASSTDSFKGREIVVTVIKVRERGKKVVICASTGNASTPAAAYATHAGSKAVVVIPERKVVLGKLSQAVIYDAEIVLVEGNFDEVLEIVKEVAQSDDDIELVNSVSPSRVEGQGTGTLEIVEQLEEAPDVLAIPVGNAGNITAYWKDFKGCHEKRGDQLPQLFGFQAEGVSPIVQDKVTKSPETIATVIHIGSPAGWKKATVASEGSNSLINSMTDDEILEAYQLMTSKKGVFSEPASNAPIAGLIKLQRVGKLPRDKRVVTVLTGNGLRDPDTAISVLDNPIQSFPNNKESTINHTKGTL